MDAAAAQPFDALGLDRAQHLGLHRERHLANLVEEDGAAVRHLELAQLALVCAGERPPLVAEQLGLEQGLRNRRAIDGHERARRARTRRVEDARAQFLAGAALALEQHGGVGAGGSFDGRQRLLQRRRGADDALAATTRGGLLLEEPVLAEEAALRERALHEQEEMIGVDGLGQEIKGALLHRRDGVLDAAVRRHHDDGHLGIASLSRRGARQSRHQPAGAGRRAPRPAASRAGAPPPRLRRAPRSPRAPAPRGRGAASPAASLCLRRGGWTPARRNGCSPFSATSRLGHPHDGPRPRCR